MTVRHDYVVITFEVIIMFDKQKFTVTENHLKLMRRMNVSYESHCEFGAPEIDPKRPYGNSDVYYDIGDMLGIKPESGDPEDPEYTEEQKNIMLKLHKETETSLQIALAVGFFESGDYEADAFTTKWTKL